MYTRDIRGYPNILSYNELLSEQVYDYLFNENNQFILEKTENTKAGIRILDDPFPSLVYESGWYCISHKDNMNQLDYIYIGSSVYDIRGRIEKFVRGVFKQGKLSTERKLQYVQQYIDRHGLKLDKLKVSYFAYPEDFSIEETDVRCIESLLIKRAMREYGSYVCVNKVLNPVIGGFTSPKWIREGDPMITF